MFIPVGFANVQWLFSAPNGRQALTALGMRGSAWAASDAEAFFIAWQQSDFWENADDSWILNGVRVIVGMTDPSAPVVYEWVGNAPGGNPGTGAPPQVSYLIKKSTLRGGRKGRGRMFVPGVPNDLVNDAGLIGSGALASLQTQWETMIDAAIGSSSADNPVLLHSESTPAPDDLTGMTLDSRVATQRRRLRG